MPNYQNTIIYKIVCKDEKLKDLYVGQTTNFSKRKSRHKTNCVCERTEKYNMFLYKFIREKGGWDNWNIIEVEKYPCENLVQASERERYWMNELNATLNKVKPQQQIYSHYDNQKEYKKAYREANKEKIKEYNIKYREANKEEAKEYREANKEKIKEYKKAYREANKEKIKSSN